MLTRSILATPLKNIHMKNKAIQQLQSLLDHKNKIAMNGLKIKIENNVKFYKSVSELISELSTIDEKKLYNINIDIENKVFLQITITLQYLTPKEINKPFKVVKIARNINSFDNDFEKADDKSVYNFWKELNTKLTKIIKTLSEKEIRQLKKLVTNHQYSIC